VGTLGAWYRLQKRQANEQRFSFRRTSWDPRRLVVFLAVVAAHTAVLVILQEEDKRRLADSSVSTNTEPAIVWLPPLPDEATRGESELDTTTQSRVGSAPAAATPHTAPATRAPAPAAAPSRTASAARARAPAAVGTPVSPTSADASPEPVIPASIDWNREISEAAASQLARSEKQRRRESVFTAPSAPASLAAAAPRPPAFAWDYAATHRIEQPPGGTLLIHLNDRCIYVFPVLFACAIGEITPNRNLFEHARDPPAASD